MDSSVENESFIKRKRDPKQKQQPLKRTISTPLRIQGRIHTFECPLSPLKDDGLINLLQDDWVENTPAPVPEKQHLEVPKRLDDTNFYLSFQEKWINSSALKRINQLSRNPNGNVKKNVQKKKSIPQNKKRSYKKKSDNKFDSMEHLDPQRAGKQERFYNVDKIFLFYIILYFRKTKPNEKNFNEQNNWQEESYKISIEKEIPRSIRKGKFKDLSKLT